MSDVVTGAAGFAGRALVRELVLRGRSVEAWCRTERDAATLDGLGADRIEAFDLLAPGELERRLQLRAPQRIFHVAALASPRACEADPDLARAVNVDVTRRLLAAAPRDTAVLVTSSAAVYAPSSRPLSEDCPSSARGVYAATKLAAEVLARLSAEKGRRVVVARPFNHAGRGQAAEYALPSFVRGLAHFRREGGAIPVGDLSSVRDYMHVSDTVRAYVELLDHARSGSTTNVCSGRTSTMGALFTELAVRMLGADGAARALACLEHSPASSQNPVADASSSHSPTATVPRVSSVVGNPYRLAILPFVPLVGLGELLDGLVGDEAGDSLKPR